MNRELLLDVRNLRTSFFTERGELRAVDGISFTIEKGKTLGIVGESGCGKSVTSLSLMRLIQAPRGKIVGGEMIFRGRDLLKLNDSEMRRLRGTAMSMIFQEPMTSLNPVFTIGDQIQEAMTVHQRLPKREAGERVIELLQSVGIPAPEKRVNDYPHHLSGGMRQRVMIAMALACGPELMIADEPTTALDVTIQAQILELLKNLQEKMGMSLILITHDLGVVSEMADETLVMYAGKVIEKGPTRDLFERPMHPYTEGLLKSIPQLRRPGEPKRPLVAIRGMVPNLFELPTGCRFQDRCEKVTKECQKAEPPLVSTGTRSVACVYPSGGQA